jgi:hypothetical protein
MRGCGQQQQLPYISNTPHPPNIPPPHKLPTPPPPTHTQTQTHHQQHPTCSRAARMLVLPKCLRAAEMSLAAGGSTPHSSRAMDTCSWSSHTDEGGGGGRGGGEVKA